MKLRLSKDMLRMLGQVTWIGIKLALVIQFARESTAVIYQGF